MPPLTICHCELGHSESLGLIIVGRRVKPAVMKTLYRTLAFVVLAVIVTLVIGSWFLTLRMVPNQKFVLYIGHKPWLGTPTYVDWTSEAAFDDALKQVCEHKGTYKIHKKLDGQEYDAKPCKEILRTVKVTKSKVADGVAAAEFVANDPNIVMKVAAASKEDITTVLNALSPTPTPTP
jgi:hypothetical protein